MRWKEKVGDTFKVMSKARCVKLGYSANVHKRRREFRLKAKLDRSRSISHEIVRWSLFQARYTK